MMVPMGSFVSLSDPRRTWSLASADTAAVADVACGITERRQLARMLVGRGVVTGADARVFLDADLDELWEEPDAIAGMPEAADRVAAAVRSGERILVFGDFDVDGVTAAALTALGLRALGGSGAVIVPNRFTDGYGLTDASVDRIVAARPQLVITVDCGITGAPQVAALRAAGVDVVVTDHHEPGADVPEGVPLVDPKLGGTAARDLSGAGVALKLLAAVGRRLGAPACWREFTDLAAIGTVADIVPLVAENRALVATGLRRMRIAPRPGIQALAAVAQISTPTLSADNIAFGLAPRLNAAGRMADPRTALQLLMATDERTAATLAAELERNNRDRQMVERELLEDALGQVGETLGRDDRLIMLAGRGWHDGVKGIVASRLATKFGLPTLLFCLDGNEARGSGRSVADVDLFAAVSACADLLGRFGGHKAAVGVALAADRLPELRRRLAATLASLPCEQFSVRRTLDADLALSEVTAALARELRVLEPHGGGNRKPVFVTEKVRLRDTSCVGRDANHLRFTATDGTASVRAIAFSCEDIEDRLACDDPVGIVFEVEADDFRGRPRAQMVVRDFVRAV